MIGQRVESRFGLPWLALGFASIGLTMAGGGIALGERPLLVGSALPFAIAVCWLIFCVDRPFAAEFLEDGIEVDGHGSPISYASLRGVRIGGRPHDPSNFRKASMPIQVEHEGGQFLIPARLNVPSHEVYRFLASCVPTCGERQVHPTLAEYLERQEGYFGPERVWIYRAASRPRGVGRFRRFRALCTGLILGGIAWIVAGSSGFVEQQWAGAGIMCSLVGVCFFLVTLANDSGPAQAIKNWKNASLVIGPQGMAMIQGDVQGEVRWPELLDVRFGSRASSFRLTQGPVGGIILKLKGADVLIADIYDRPLYVIHDRILDCSGRAYADEVVDL